MKLRDSLFLLAILAPGLTHAATLETLGTVLVVQAGAFLLPPDRAVGQLPIAGCNCPPGPGQSYRLACWLR